MVDERLIEAIECCRAESDDLALQEMALLAAHLRDDEDLAKQFRLLQQLDVKIASAMSDVSLPDGLADRLIARLHEAQSARAQVETKESAIQQLPKHPKKNSRRAALVAAVLATAAALLLIVRQDWFTSPEDSLTSDQLRAAAADWYETVRENENWQKNPAPPGYAISSRISLRPRRWTRFSDVYDGIAYDLTPPGSRHATYLLVLRTTAKGLPPNPPRRPFWTQGRGIAEWQSGELLYVLVVEGPSRRYRKILDTGVGPLA